MAVWIAVLSRVWLRWGVGAFQAQWLLWVVG